MHKWAPGDSFPQQQGCHEWGQHRSWPSWILAPALLLENSVALGVHITLGKPQMPAVKWMQESIRDFSGPVDKTHASSG